MLLYFHNETLFCHRNFGHRSTHSQWSQTGICTLCLDTKYIHSSHNNVSIIPTTYQHYLHFLRTGLVPTPSISVDASMSQHIFLFALLSDISVFLQISFITHAMHTDFNWIQNALIWLQKVLEIYMKLLEEQFELILEQCAQNIIIILKKLKCHLISNVVYAHLHHWVTDTIM